MRKLILLFAVLILSAPWALAAPGAPSRSASLQNLRIRGILMYDNDKSVETTGLYSYTVTAPVERRMLRAMPRVYVNGGSVVFADKLHTFSYQIDYGYVSSAKYYVYDINTGQEISSKSMGYDLATVYGHAATSSAVNPADGVVYSSGYEYNAAEKTLQPQLKIWDLDSDTKTTIGDMQASLIAMAFDKTGQLWGITASSSQTSADGGFLVRVDKATGELTMIGDTGVRPYFDQSAVINPDSGVFYWLANTQTEDANLYTVDLATGKAELVSALPNGDEVVAATIKPPEYVDAAPSSVGNLTLVAEPAYTLKVSFDMPTKAYDGSDIAGQLDYTVCVRGADAELQKQGTANAGGKVEVSFELAKSEEVAVTVAASAGDIAGPDVESKAYVGYEKMHAVGNISLKHENGSNILQWEAPSTGHFNGHFKPDELRYLITRMPEGEVVAEAHDKTIFTEAVTDENLRSTYYTIEAVNGDVKGDAARSEAIITGSAVNPPYQEGFDEESSLGLYDILDANEDGNTWYYSVKSVKYRQSTSSAADDYLFLPPMSLVEGYSYELSFDAYGTNTRYVNVVDVLIGSSMSPDDMEVLNAEPLSYSNDSRSAVNEKITIKPSSTGRYYIGLHLVSGKSQGTFTIDNVAVSAGSSTAVPAAASSFTVSAGARGALEASLAITAPTLTAGGKELGSESIDLTITRGDDNVFSGKLAPGESKIITDNKIQSSGTVKYEAYFSNTYGDGELAEAEVYVGVDEPSVPSDVLLVDNNNGIGRVAWTPAPEGLNGGYVDSDKVRYTVFEPSSGKVFKTGVAGTFADIDLPAEGEQTVYSVGVAASYGSEATSPSASSNEILVGAPYALPYAESFAAATVSTKPWIKEVVSGKSSDSQWYARPDQVQDGDGGAADMTAYAAVASRWAGPKIDISGAVDPVASAWVYMPTGSMAFTLQLQKDNGEWISLKTIDNAADDWVCVSAPLCEYKSKNVRLGLLGECFGGMHFLYVDNIRVDDSTSGIGMAADAEGCEVTVINGDIEVRSACETQISVYSADGKCVSTATARYASITVSPGVYMVRAGNRTFKVAL